MGKNRVQFKEKRSGTARTWSPPEPAPGAVCGYIGGLGPFYTQTRRQSDSADQIELRTNVVNTQTSNAVKNNVASAAPDLTTAQREENEQNLTDDLEYIVESPLGMSDSEFCRVRQSWKKIQPLPRALTEITSIQDDYHNRTEGASESFNTDDVRRAYFDDDEDVDWRPLSSASSLRFRLTWWMSIAISCLAVANGFFLTAFLTNSWGVMTVAVVYHTDEATSETVVDGEDREVMSEDADVYKQWNFGLWQCCREDGLCLGTRWPVLYMATRACSVFSLFGHALSLAWTLGHTAERLLLFDPCTMTTLATFCFVTGTLSLGSVSCFSSVWPSHFHKVLRISSSHLGYSFFLVLFTIPLTYVAGVSLLIDFRSSWTDFQAQLNLNQNYTTTNTVEQLNSQSSMLYCNEADVRLSEQNVEMESVDSNVRQRRDPSVQLEPHTAQETRSLLDLLERTTQI